jgi:ribosomal protein L16 Arg81 hydroxylase
LDFDLTKLLQPLPVERFFAEHWERRHLHIERGDADYFSALLRESDLDALLSDPDLRYPAIQLAKDGGYLPPELHTRQQITAQYQKGATISLPALHRTCAPLRSLCDALQAELDHAAHANVYLTPANAAGFTPHYDTHEVFVLQITGEKHWTLYPPPIDLPHRSQVFDPNTYTPTAPIAQLHLRAGDLLYLPRGIVHSTTTGVDPSTHITLGITVYTWADLVGEALKSSIETPELRRALPPSFATRPDLKPLLRARLLQTLHALQDEDAADQIIDSLTHRVRAAARAPRPTLSSTAVTRVDAHSRLSSPAPTSFRITQTDGHTGLEFRGKRHLFPIEASAVLHQMTATSEFRTADLRSSMTAEATLGLSRYLVDIGFLTQRTPST